MKRNIIVLLSCICITGCAWTSEAMKVGDNTYQASANSSPARGGATEARELALDEANKKCDSLGKDIEVIDTSTGWSFPANNVFTVTFKCNPRSFKAGSASTPNVNQATSTSPTTASDRLKELDSMYKQGLITESEYQAKKKQILDGL